jgi:hypothetical protein
LTLSPSTFSSRSEYYLLFPPNCQYVGCHEINPPLLLSILIFLPTISSADHGPPSASSPDELILQLSERLDDLADEYFLAPGEQPNFDEPRFNRLVGAARIALERARRQLNRGRVCLGIRWLSRSVSLLDRATRFAIKVNMSGSGFSDDLASYTRAIAEFTTEDLLVLAASDPGVPPLVLTFALALEAHGDELQQSDVGHWAPSMRHYTAAFCLLVRFL